MDLKFLRLMSLKKKLQRYRLKLSKTNRKVKKIMNKNFKVGKDAVKKFYINKIHL